jgi:hypothetical protein
MIDPVRVAANLYTGLTRLFPREFQGAFGEELQDVFYSMAKEAVFTGGTQALTVVCLRELHDLPGNILHEHLAGLRKTIMHSRFLGSVSPARSAGQGALGFGLGFGLLIVVRWLSDPRNAMMFTHYGASLLRETLMFSLMAALGWLMICRSVFSPLQIKRISVASLQIGGLGGLLGTSFIGFSYHVFGSQLYMIPFFGTLVQFTAAVIYGAFFGAIFGFLEGRGERLIHLAWHGSACFGFSFLISEAAFRLFYLLPVSWSWRQEYWVIPLAVTAAISGSIGGALLGWVVGQEKPPQPTRRVEILSAGADRSILEDGKLI